MLIKPEPLNATKLGREQTRKDRLRWGDKQQEPLSACILHAQGRTLGIMNCPGGEYVFLITASLEYIK